MDKPMMVEPRAVGADTVALLSYLPVPPSSLLPVNAYLIRAAQPVLVDTGMAAVRDDFLRYLSEVIPIADLQWLWLTHTDPDHVGSYREVVDQAPNLRVVTTFVGMGKLGLLGLPVERTYLLNPGQSLYAGDRELRCVKPPTFDAPETTAIVDAKTGAFFSADTFGALIPEPFQDATQIEPAVLRDGLVTWTTVDSPWLHMVDRRAFTQSLGAVHALDPSIILSSHLPPAAGMTDTLLEYLNAVPAAQPFEGPDQVAFERMLAGVPSV